MRILLGLVLLAASFLAHPFDRGVAQAQQIVLPCVPSGNSCIPVSAANPLPTTGGGSLVIGTTAITGGATTQVLFNLGGVVSSDADFTYAGSGGLVRITGSYVSGTPMLGLGSSGTNTGISANSTTLQMDAGGNVVGAFSSAGRFQLSNQASAGIDLLGNGANVLQGFGTNGFQFGGPDVAAPSPTTIQASSVVAGNTNTGGATLTINGSKSNGSGGGDVVFQTTLSSAGSGVQNTLTPALTLKGGTQAANFTSTISAALSNVATTSAVCYNTGTGLLTYDGTIGTCNASDETLKTFFGSLSGNLSKLVTLSQSDHFGYFRWNDGDGALKIGAGAQTVAKVYPELVERGSNGIYSLAYDKLTIPLIAGLAELKIEFDEYKKSHP